jgi:hypothetical protein
MKNHIIVSSQFEVPASVHQVLVFVTTIGLRFTISLKVEDLLGSRNNQKLKPLCFEVSEAFFFELKKIVNTNIRCHILVVG